MTGQAGCYAEDIRELGLFTSGAMPVRIALTSYLGRYLLTGQLFVIKQYQEVRLFVTWFTSFTNVEGHKNFEPQASF